MHACASGLSVCRTDRPKLDEGARGSAWSTTQYSTYVYHKLKKWSYTKTGIKLELEADSSGTVQTIEFVLKEPGDAEQICSAMFEAAMVEEQDVRLY